MANRLYSTIALVCVLASPAHAAETTVLTGEVNQAMIEKAQAAVARGERTIAIASPGGNSALGWRLGEILHFDDVTVRCVGYCASAAAHVLLASRRCVIARSGHLVLHMAYINPYSELGKALGARVEFVNAAVRDQWSMQAALRGVPPDIIDRLQNSMSHAVELSVPDMKRVGCTVEGSGDITGARPISPRIPGKIVVAHPAGM